MNDLTLLMRQVHPDHFPAGELSSQAFFPFPKDDGKLSVYDGDLMSAQQSHDHYVEQGLKSLGVWAVSGGEVVSVQLNYAPDPLVTNTAHAVVDFAQRNEKECRKLAKKLKKLAIDRGHLYRAA